MARQGKGLPARLLIILYYLNDSQQRLLVLSEDSQSVLTTAAHDAFHTCSI